MAMQRIQNSQKKFEKEVQSWRTALHDFKTHYKIILRLRYLQKYRWKKYRQIVAHIRATDFWEMCKGNLVEKR